jgi:DNA-binding XRE family transcriptional regulator
MQDIRPVVGWTTLAGRDEQVDDLRCSGICQPSVNGSRSLKEGALAVELDVVAVDMNPDTGAFREAIKMRQIFGRNLRRTRIAAGLTPDDIQDRTGVPRELIDEIEQGQVDPCLRTIAALALAVDRDLCLLFDPAD